MLKKKKMTKAVKAMPIRTVYYLDGQIVKINRAAYANRAVVNCIALMQSNKYEANVAEVFNEDTGTLYAVIRCTVNGMEIIYAARSTPDLMSFYLIKKGAK